MKTAEVIKILSKLKTLNFPIQTKEELDCLACEFTSCDAELLKRAVDIYYNNELDFPRSPAKLWRYYLTLEQKSKKNVNKKDIIIISCLCGYNFVINKNKLTEIIKCKSCNTDLSLKNNRYIKDNYDVDNIIFY